MEYSILFSFFPGVNSPVPRGWAPINPEFGCEVSIARPKIVPPSNRTHVLPNDSSFGGAH